MGKPTNTRSAGCAITTSNSVVWQGPDLCCINICTGDTISDVMNEIAKKICTIFEVLDVRSYDLSELIGKDCPPENFIELIQLLITAVSNQSVGTSTVTAAGCPECEMTLATCFQVGGNTSLPMTDYISAIAAKVCEQSITIQTQNNAILQLTQQLATVKEQLAILIG